MTPADWAIVALIALNVLLAAMHGFFAEALSLAGLVVGYVVAAWQYPRLADWLLKFLNSQLLAEIFGFLIIFFRDPDRVQHCGTDREKANEGSRSKRLRSLSGRVAGRDEGRAGGSCCPDGDDGLHSDFFDVGEVRIGPLFSGGRESGDLGGAIGFASQILRGTRFLASRSQGFGGHSGHLEEISDMKETKWKRGEIKKIK